MDLTNLIPDIEKLRRPNFKPEEFIRSNTASRLKIPNIPSEEAIKNLMIVADKMQQLREKFRLVIDITSGFRSEELNKAVGGSSNSRHMQGLACDFNVRGLEPQNVVNQIKKLSNFSCDKCFIERNCVHIQFQKNEKDNRNLFATAEKINGEWVVTRI